MTEIQAYEVLGIRPGATPVEVRASYLDLVKVWHPDRFGHDPKLRAKAEQRLQVINAAYERLKALGFPAPPRASSSAQRTDEPTPSDGAHSQPIRPVHRSPEVIFTPPADRTRRHLIGVSAVILLLILFIGAWLTSMRTSKLQPHPQQATEAEPHSPPVPTISLSEADIQRYRSGLTDPRVVHLRKALNNYYNGNTEGIEDRALDDDGQGLAHFQKDYYKSPFVVLAYDQHTFGGRSILIIFREKPDRLFRAWVYQYGGGDYVLRRFVAEPVLPTKLRTLLESLKPVLDNAALAL